MSALGKPKSHGPNRGVGSKGKKLSGSVPVSRPVWQGTGLGPVHETGDFDSPVDFGFRGPRRGFAPAAERFGEHEDARRAGELVLIVDSLRMSLRNEKTTRKMKRSVEKRLAYHQRHSQPTMDQLKGWLEGQFADKRVEPNSALREVISYMLKHWEPLTLFLRQAGAPLDNSICERALNNAIIHRKNSLLLSIVAMVDGGRHVHDAHPRNWGPQTDRPLAQHSSPRQWTDLAPPHDYFWTRTGRTRKGSLRCTSQGVHLVCSRRGGRGLA